MAPDALVLSFTGELPWSCSEHNFKMGNPIHLPWEKTPTACKIQCPPSVDFFFPWKMSIWTDSTDSNVLEIISNQLYTYFGLISCLWNHMPCLKSLAWTCKLIITTAAPMNLMTNYRLPSDDQLGVKEALRVNAVWYIFVPISSVAW